MTVAGPRSRAADEPPAKGVFPRGRSEARATAALGPLLGRPLLGRPLTGRLLVGCLLVGCLLLVGLGGDGGGVSLVVGSATNRQVSAGLAHTPPMGWNSWNALGGNVRDGDLRAAADALVSSGMRAAGYRYVIVDDGWMAPTRGSDGRLVADPERFPAGIAALAAYVHARGLKFGLYASPGRTTCQGLPGSFGHETTDAATFAA
ncbi:glycoside hydrolase family 27 protein [Candidatus Frankia alpina]|uniref:glycoside hydrolase family 27 protein n=1 Tax=Candidatus Frankia alpina TaxID=2699483 RepID=UPI0013CF83B6|nr:glycoside hydrolase family 27 protein [Candidatus Frankia alpina]